VPAHMDPAAAFRPQRCTAATSSCSCQQQHSSAPASVLPISLLRGALFFLFILLCACAGAACVAARLSTSRQRQPRCALLPVARLGGGARHLCLQQSKAPTSICSRGPLSAVPTHTDAAVAAPNKSCVLP
jgi:hypothetical protein